MKRKTDKEVEEALDKLFESYEKLIFRASDGSDSGSVKVFKKKLFKGVDNAQKAIQGSVASFVNSSIQTAELSKNARKLLKNAGSIYDDLAVKKTTYQQIMATLTEAAQTFKGKVNEYINTAPKGTVRSVGEVIGFVSKTIEEGGATTVRYKNGAEVKAKSYASMLSLTTRTETANVSALGIALDDDNDLVEIPAIDYTCPLCAVMQGRIYSITGKTKGYPKLYETAFKSGYSTIHPNCRHRVFPYDPRFHTDAENEKLQKGSNRPFEQDSGDKHFQQSKEAAETYAKEQAWLRQMNAEENAFEEMKAVYEARGEEPPYKTLGGFRRAYRSEEGSEAYMKAHYWKKGLDNQKGLLDKKEKPAIIREKSENYKTLEKIGIEKKPPKKHTKKITEVDIIKSVGGGDLTKGSCASLSWAYCGNKAGYNVKDFRDGESRSFFASRKVSSEIATLEGVKSFIVEDSNDIKACTSLFQNMEDGKEYVLCTGKHSSVIKKVGNERFYLELQDPTNNGWKHLDGTVLKRRFGAVKSRTMFGEKYTVKNILIEAETLGKNKDFIDLLDFINTEEGKEKKGNAGTKK